MAIKTTAQTSNLPPVGLYLMRLTDIEDLGVQTSQFGDQHQVRLILNVERVIDCDDEVADEYIGLDVFGYANYVFTPRAKLRGWCEAIAGRKIEDGEEFDSSEIEGKLCKVTIGLNDNGNPKVSDIATYKAPRRKKKPQPVEDDDLDFEDGEEPF